MFSPVTHILPLTKIRRASTLPGKGTVLVLVGQKVSATDFVAEAPPRLKHIMLDVPNALGIPRSKFSRQIITRKAGEKLAKGDVIAENRKLFNRVLRAPVSGEILMISGGRILFEEQEQAVKIRAGYTGTVVEVIPEYGVVIETSGTLIQGIWGNGKVNTGPLHVINGDAGGILTAEQIDDSLRDTIGLAGQCRDKAVLLAAAQLPMKGLILGSMSAELVETARQLDMPVMLLEGFTKTGINQAAARILYGNEQREVCLNALELNRFRGERPEAIIPLQAAAEFPPEIDVFRTGKVVRVLDDLYPSAIAEVIAYQPEPALLPNGLRTKVATIRLENNEKVFVPIANLEILG